MEPIGAEGLDRSLTPAASDTEADLYVLAKTSFDLKEYYRASHFLKDAKSARSVFLRSYALFLAGEKRKGEEALETAGSGQGGVGAAVQNSELPALRDDLARLHAQGQLDGFGLYLYGVLLGHVGAQSVELRIAFDDRNCDPLDGGIPEWSNGGIGVSGVESEGREERGILHRSVLVAAIKAYPYNWAAWLELASTLKDSAMLERVEKLLPEGHIFRPLWRAHALLDLQANQPALTLYLHLATLYPNSLYIRGQIAVAHYNLQDYDAAEALLEAQLAADPYRLTNLDTYSNILYVKNKPAKLSFLAHKASVTEKYTAETCCIIGNYYSLKGEREKAILYFDRALKLNPKYLAVWTLMGHEYMELRNTAAAISAYRRAVDINPRDYRAWYGLGQTYELLQMPLYALYYYGKACELRTYDSRMWAAMGGCYEAIGNVPNAILAYERAVANRDPEGLALIKLAKLYESLQTHDKAAYFYKRSLDLLDASGAGETTNSIDALIYLARYCKNSGRLEEANEYCSRLLDFNGKEKEEAKALLQEIHSLRRHAPAKAQAVQPAVVPRTAGPTGVTTPNISSPVPPSPGNNASSSSEMSMDDSD